MIVGIAFTVPTILFALFIIVQPNSFPPKVLTKADLTIARILDCTANCTAQINMEVVSKYPELKSGIALMDERYKELSKVCDTNECLEKQYSERGGGKTYKAYYSISASRANQMFNDLRQNGAQITGQGIDIHGSTFEFNIRNATYHLSLSHQNYQMIDYYLSPVII